MIQKENYHLNIRLTLFLISILILVSNPILAQVESDPPVLNGIVIDKVSVDVSGGAQTVTFTLDISDETGIDWDRSCLCINAPSGSLIILRSTDGNFTLDLTSMTFLF